MGYHCWNYITAPFAVTSSVEILVEKVWPDWRIMKIQVVKIVCFVPFAGLTGLGAHALRLPGLQKWFSEIMGPHIAQAR